MKPEREHSEPASPQAAAASWIVRRDRGLSAAEAAEFQLWLAADPAHAAALRRAEGAWARLDRIPEALATEVIATSTRKRSFWKKLPVVASLAAAAGIAIAGALWFARPSASEDRPQATNFAEAADGPRQLTLSDGSVVELNRGSEIVEQFTAAERRITLVRGEAHFSVAKNPARPFVVRAGHVDVRAVGTVFNVHLESAAVEVLVTEGIVKLHPSADGATRHVPAAESIPSLHSQQRAVIALAPTSPEVAVVVTTVSQEEIARALAWQEPLLRLSGATLAEVAANFEQRTGRRVILADPALGRLRLGGRFRADDVEGFASVLAATLDVEVEHAPDGALVLRKKNSGSR
jgi:transmembrane sensor